jgi:hypothetical protein
VIILIHTSTNPRCCAIPGDYLYLRRWQICLSAEKVVSFDPKLLPCGQVCYKRTTTSLLKFYSREPNLGECGHHFSLGWSSLLSILLLLSIPPTPPPPPLLWRRIVPVVPTTCYQAFLGSCTVQNKSVRL